MNGEMFLKNVAGVFATRRESYGEARTMYRLLAERWSLVLGREVSAAHVVLCLIELKLARLAHDPAHMHSVVDVAGYAAVLYEVMHGS